MSENDLEVETEAVETNETPEVSAEVEATAEPAAEEAVEEESATSEDEKPKKRGANARIRELVAKQHELEQELAQANERNGSAPDPEGYDGGEFDPRYIADLATQQMRAQQASEAAERKRILDEQIVQHRQNDFLSKVETAKQDIPDYEKVAFGDHIQPFITPIVAEAVQTADRSADVAYYLGKHVEEAAEIARMSPMQAAMAVARIENSLPKPQKVSQAPEPISPITGSTSGGEKTPEEMTGDEFRAWRNKKLYG
jgi:hypothetical protein